MPPNCRRDDRIRKIILLPHYNFQFKQGTSTDAKNHWVKCCLGIGHCLRIIPYINTNYEIGNRGMYIRKTWQSPPQPRDQTALLSANVIL